MITKFNSFNKKYLLILELLAAGADVKIQDNEGRTGGLKHIYIKI